MTISGRSAGVVAYGFAFAGLLPLLLISWTRRLDSLIPLPAIDNDVAGFALGIIGILIIANAVVMLRLVGGGWPMSPYPPERHVDSGAYRLVRDPIYAGSVLLCAGVSIVYDSGAGLWITTPLLAIFCFAFVTGYEHDATAARFGSGTLPLIRLAASSDERPALADRMSVYLICFLPWLIIFEGLNAFGIPRDVIDGWTALDRFVPVIPWTEIVYFLDYVIVLAAPLVAASRREVRELILRGWLATAFLSLIYIGFPVIVLPREVPAGPFAIWMQWERSFDDALTSFPSFHVVWAIIAAATFVNAFPRFRTWWWLLAGAISVSCLTTGMHAIWDVVAGVVAGVAVLKWREIRSYILRGTELVANSWREWDGGYVRAMSHGIWAAAGAAAGVVIAARYAGGVTLSIVMVVLSSIAGAALWAQFVEGSPQLLRPYGYYGGLIGGIVPIIFADDPWLILAAVSIAATIIVPLGRMRCLVQGCCHGRIAGEDSGIRYRHPRSRVTRLSALAGAPLHPTQLYSILWNLVMFVLLSRLWSLAAPLELIAGMYFVLSGVGRFVEEHYRGEPQTKIVAGLRIYQWLAIASAIAGMTMMVAGNTPAPLVGQLITADWMIALGAGVVAYVAYGVDFPRLNTRFARLV